MSKTKVLFLCTGNTTRSQMAEAFLRKYGGERFEAYSAGLRAKEIHPYTNKVMSEIGISLDGHCSKSLSEFFGKMHFGFLITVCDVAEKECPSTFPGIGKRIHWNFEDPAAFEGTEEEKLQKFRQVRDEIEERIREWIKDDGF
jgi:arsenate reductase (thioredoxin)